MFRHHLSLLKKERIEKSAERKIFEFEFFLVFFLDAIFCSLSLVFFVLLFVLSLSLSLSLSLKYY